MFRFLQEAVAGKCGAKFQFALEALGIPYRFVAARPMTYAVRRLKTHVAIIASIDGAEWLCDLGFGGYGIREPIDLAIRYKFFTFI
jgi:N-hydroxyarylamine O-acetyltransferase